MEHESRLVRKSVCIALCALLIVTVLPMISGPSTALIDAVSTSNQWRGFIPDQTSLIDQTVVTTAEKQETTGKGNVALSANIHKIETGYPSSVVVDMVAIADSRLDMGYSSGGPYSIESYNDNLQYLPGKVLDIDDLPDNKVAGKGAGIWVDVLDFDYKPHYFNFFGVNVGKVWICSNGFVSFDSQAVNSGQWISAYPQTIPNPSIPNGMVAGLWRDLYFDPSAGSKILYGMGPYDSFYVCWINMKNTADDQLQTFGLIFYPWQGYGLEKRIDLVIEKYTPITGTKMGLEDFKGTRGCAVSAPASVPADGQFWLFNPDVSNDYRVKKVTIFMAKGYTGVDNTAYVTIEGWNDAYPSGMNIDEYKTGSEADDDGAYVAEAIMSCIKLGVSATSLGVTAAVATELIVLATPAGPILLGATGVVLAAVSLAEVLSPAPEVSEEDDISLTETGSGKAQFLCKDDFNEADPLDVVGYRPWYSTVNARLYWRLNDVSPDHTLRIWTEVEFEDYLGNTKTLTTDSTGSDGGIILTVHGKNTVSGNTYGATDQTTWEGRTYPDSNYYRFAPRGGHVTGTVGYYVSSEGTDDSGYDVMGWNKLSYDPVNDYVTSSNGAICISGYFAAGDTLPSSMWPSERKLNVYIFYCAPDSYSYNGFLHDAPVKTVQVLGSDADDWDWYYKEVVVTGLLANKHVKVAIGRPAASNPSYMVEAYWSAVTITSVTVPTAPRNLAASAYDCTTTHLTWDAPLSDGGTDLTGYKLYRGTYSGGEVIVKDSPWWGTSTYDFDLNPGTTYYYKVKAVNDAGDSPYSNEASATTIDTPTITVTYPNGGETWYLGNTYDITWTSYVVQEPLRIGLFMDGALRRYIETPAANDGICTWTVDTDLTPGNTYQVSILGVDPVWTQDLSDSYFSILAPSGPVITTLTPDGGESWTVGTSRAISWMSYGVTGDVRIELYKGGSYYSTIASSTPNDGVYVWTLGTDITSGTDYKIKLSGVSTAVEDFSNGYFSILGGPEPTITVIAPNGGESWVMGTVHTISWSTVGLSGDVRIELYKGLSYSSTIASTTTNDGSFGWTLSTGMTAGTDYSVKIVGVSTSVYDFSDGYFTVAAAIPDPLITVVTPNGGETWTMGTTQSMTWTSENNPGSYVKIELYRGGLVGSQEVFVQTIISSTTNDGAHSWYVPTSLTGASDYRIKISSTTTTANDYSNNYFTIVGAPTITVTSPNGGETWFLGTYHTITWTSANNPGSYVKIELYKGTTLTSTITSSTLNDGVYGWTIPTTLKKGDDYRIRISSTSTSAYDYSNSYFTLNKLGGGGGGGGPPPSPKDKSVDILSLLESVECPQLQPSFLDSVESVGRTCGLAPVDMLKDRDVACLTGLG